MQMFNACLNCVACFKSLRQMPEEELWRQEQYYSVIWSKYVCPTVWYGQNMYVLQCDMVKICVSFKGT